MKIRGVYILTLRNIKRMIAVLAAAFFASCTSATSPENIAIAGRISNATLTLKVLECSALASGAACVVVPDIQYVECKALYLDMRKAAAHAAPALPAAGRSYSPRKTITVARAASITGLSVSTIKRLDRNPGNTNYPGRNSTAKILAAWARLHRENKHAAREVRAANRPSLGHVRG